MTAFGHGSPESMEAWAKLIPLQSQTMGQHALAQAHTCHRIFGLLSCSKWPFDFKEQVSLN